MADLTHSAVDSLLGLLTGAIKNEFRLLGGVQGDIQFIKDEMDSMNGFLLHLTKMQTEHDDQLRAWMKQVRDIAYIADDCMELYMRDLRPTESGFWALIRHLPVLLRTVPARRRLAKKIRKLKDRVREVGERRLRYGVTVPEAKPKPKPVSKDITTDKSREKFLRALEVVEDDHRSTGVPSPSFSTAIHQLPYDLATDAGTVIEKIRVKCVPDHVESMKMLLRALYAYPHGTKEELESLEDKLNRRAADVPNEVMVFCYSKLSTHYKSCLQYLTAFLDEASISRTSLVRRWVAEGLVVRDKGKELQTMEEAGECCFNELVFRGFVRPATRVDTGPKIKSCNMESSVREFVIAITQSENFVAGGLPTHFDYQLDIRKIVQGQPQQQPLQRQRPWNIWDGLCAVPREPQQDDDDGKLHPMDKVVQKLKNLPEEYRLNVLDLGGCKGLKKCHLKSICKVLSIKYLSLRNTDVSRLPRAINNLWKLQTLDVRQTDLHPSDTAHIVLPNLKHLLAGSINRAGDEIESLSTVQMPRKIGRSTKTEVLRHVQILDGKVEPELQQVGHLKQLRKLGVVLSGSEDNIKHLLRTISKLSECLRSLSVWITAPPPMAGDGGGVTLDNKEGTDGISSSPPKYLESLNIKYFKGTSTSGSLPPWIEGLKLLSKITLRDTQLSANGLRILGKLESLCCLRLRRGSYTEDNISLKKGDFPKLQFLLIDQVCPTIRIAFEADAAPKLQRVVWTFDKNKKMEIMAGTISGIDNLRSLKELELNGDWIDREDYVNQALAAHPKYPLLRCSFPDSFFTGPTAHEVSITET
ncbi:disease resistance protein PIK6-NP-like [Phragmites australis]|uniref:disease resistance protein PIK6-NP-like n=1 Tax=Phragmites australis TaxID=29695 RepID=UPI002D793330|nr:disease resistance protein PIK6-NP-like [Phragmites australis]